MCSLHSASPFTHREGRVGVCTHSRELPHEVAGGTRERRSGVGASSRGSAQRGVAWPGAVGHQLPPAATGLAALGCFASRSLFSVLCMTIFLVSMVAFVLLRFSELFLLGLPDSGTIQKAFSENPCEPGAGHGQATGWQVLLLLSRDSECVVDRVPTWLGSWWLGPPALPHSRMLKPGRQADRRR